MKLILVSYKKIHFMHRDFHRQSVDKLVHKVDNWLYYCRRAPNDADTLFTNCNIRSIHRRGRG